ncbi:hypothetical protein [Anaerocolumna chitinilytica]|uniref:Alpha/beta hydrolase n=1 Tax=Anaerocolumna chitinilytica TaxID=1727145 RepID=A0A7I8DQ48_9FIRM|nr:hypothetical protein [Anaerocolumna chitinilytica]BCJ99215.1 hypothetical protein bsdcttw_22560 [Anaerocolumna chitinilytica]
MESEKAFGACSIAFGVSNGISIDNSLITYPSLVIRTSNNKEEENRLRAEAEYFHAEYMGIKDATHTGLLIGERYPEVVASMLRWLERF